MKKLFAIPTENGKLCAHFGHCEKFAIIETVDRKIIDEKYVSPPVHEPGAYPAYLAQQGVNTIISGGMGQKARQLFNHNNIEVHIGVNAESPKILVEQYLRGELKTGENLCDH
ncbi:MAG: hypothetical protein JXR46_09680 [Calditrichaceae bacterium]|nr:hypothetical protein [Calditrichaceae bacterium]MBN2709303.1 hypothetical protein [Calditrichaceae bacterium]RQV92000.1 MAG: ATPase [Calditrichota bacterium]